MTPLAERVRVDRRFARSARIDSDLHATPPLTGYILQPSVRRALESMTDSLREGTQAAFTWTGPYGGGKSCAAILVANLVAEKAEGGDLAREIAGDELATRFAGAFPTRRRGWTVVALTGRRVELRHDLVDAASRAFKWSKADAGRLAEDGRALIARLEAEAAKRDGVLLLVDELGKYLEYAVSGGGGDVHLLQDLAERANRSSGRLVVVGLLHQSFEQYAGRLGRTGRDEWAKVQGRYLDVSFVAGVDEVAALISRAVTGTDAPQVDALRLSERTAAAVASRRAIDPLELAQVLAGAWPLHPVTTLLLGPVSRQRFAQNERSVFGFLSSAEPHGFQAHLEATDADADVDAQWFGPDRLWDYLVANFGSSLGVGSDGARIALAIEAVERAGLNGDLHGRIAKSAVVIELFRNGSGLAVTDEVLALCVPDAPASRVAEAVADLVERFVLIRQPRLGGYAIFAGSDFDLEDAITRHREQLDAAALSDLPARLQIGPVAAKRHYIETGALRTFDVVLQLGEDLGSNLTGWSQACASRIARAKRKSTGLLVLLLPDGSSLGADPNRAAKTLAAELKLTDVVCAVGVARSAFLLREHAADLYAIDRLEASHPQLEGDRIARRGLAARRGQVVEGVRRELLSALGAAVWFSGEGRLNGFDGAPLSLVASRIAQLTFSRAPILHSELLHRDRPSTNAMAAMRALAYAMVNHGSEEDLGISGYPAERGLYLTVLKPFGLHRPSENGTWRFGDPDDGVAGASLAASWSVATRAGSLRLDELFKEWGAPPFGIKRGVMPILALAFLLAHRATLAVYVEGMFQPQVDEIFVDRLLQNPGLIEFRRVRRTRQDEAFMAALAHLLASGEGIETQALPVASRLYQRFRGVPSWAQRTLDLPEMSRRIRDVVLKASDPEALLFGDLMEVLREEAEPAVRVMSALADCEGAYARLLADLRRLLAEQVGVDEASFEGIGARAAGVGGVTADLRFDAFAMRVGAFETGGDIEGLASLLIHKPARSWTDREHQQAVFELSKLTRRFREAEAFAAVKGRSPTSEAISVVVGLDARTQPLVHAFEVTAQERRDADRLAERLLATLHRGKPSNGVVELAAVARLLERLSRSDREAA